MKRVRVLLLLAGILSSGCATWAGKPPPCPSPSDYAIQDITEMVEENIEDPSKYSYVLYFIGEIERFCSSLASMRDG